MQESELSQLVRRNIDERIRAMNTNPTRVAKRAKLGTTAVRDILEGRSDLPNIRTLLRIADALDCQVYDLLGHSGDAAPLTRREPVAPLEARQLERGFLELRLNQVVTVSQFMRIMAILNDESQPAGD